MRNFTIRCLTLCAGLALTGAIAGAAQASSPNVVSAIKAQDKIISKAPAWKALKHEPTSIAQVKKLISDIASLEKLGVHAVAVVSRSSTTSAKQRQGKADWINGSREQDRGLLELGTALKDALAGNGAGSAAEYTKGIAKVNAGTALGSKGDRLLGLPPND
jgi:hypothetical protein